MLYVYTNEYTDSKAWLAFILYDLLDFTSEIGFKYLVSIEKKSIQLSNARVGCLKKMKV